MKTVAQDIKIIKVENGFIVTALGSSHVASTEEEVITAVQDKLSAVLKKLQEEQEEIKPLEQKKGVT